MVLGAGLIWQGRLDEAEPWAQRAERVLRAETHPVLGFSIRNLRGVLEMARGRDTEALPAFQAAEPLARQLVTPHHTVPQARAMVVHALVRLGETQRAEQALAGLSEQDRDIAEVRIAAAALRLAQNDPLAALAALAPVLDRRAPVWRVWLAMAYVLEATARDTLGEPAAASGALERALDLAEPDGAITPFALYPSPGLLERHARHPTAHASLLAEVQRLLSGTPPSPSARPLLEAPSDSELRVLRYLPTNLTGPEIARELHVSPNTVKAHIRNLYTKLGTHHRTEAVQRARALGLLAPSRTGPTAR
jgi:LuxR family maltose regulon positive regulatory protein